MSDGRHGEIPEDMPATLLMERWYAEKYHWPPQVVRELPLDAYEWFPTIDRAAQAAQQSRAAAEQRTPRNPRLG